MGDKIVLDIMGFDAANTEIHKVIDDLDNVKKVIENCNSSLIDKWKGRSSEKFLGVSDSLNKNFDVYIKELNHLANTLQDIRTAFIEKDNELDRFIKDHESQNKNIL